ncbi:MAG: autotransporter assembly complex protein TamA, partial [Caulobacteraceae bacterium]
MGRVRVAASALAFFAAAVLAPALALAAQPKALVEGRLARPLKAEIERAVGVSKSRPTTRLDARRRAREAAQAAIAALRSEGYYDYEVEAEVGAGTPPTALVRVTPGPLTRIGQARIEWDGPPPDPATIASGAAALDLPAGTPGRAAEVLAAEGRVAASLHAHGYADAATRPREVVVDHADHTMSPTFRFAAGALVRLDGVEVTSKGRTRAPWVASLAPWKRGSIYDPADLAKLERRLRDTGVFNAVTVALAPANETKGGLRPVVVSLVDRAPRTIELGAGYSTSEGAGLDAKWSFYNLLGRADTVALTGRLAQIQQKLDAELDLPSWGGADRIFRTGGDVFADH